MYKNILEEIKAVFAYTILLFYKVALNIIKNSQSNVVFVILYRQHAQHTRRASCIPNNMKGAKASKNLILDKPVAKYLAITGPFCIMIFYPRFLALLIIMTNVSHILKCFGTLMKKEKIIYRNEIHNVSCSY
jgi:hypothetical protein